MPPVRVVILGSSFGATVHAAGFRRHPGFVVVGLAGSDAERTRRRAAEHGIPEADDDWRRLLVRTRPDLVAVVTPVDLQRELALAASERCMRPACAARRLSRIAVIRR